MLKAHSFSKTSVEGNCTLSIRNDGPTTSTVQSSLNSSVVRAMAFLRDSFRIGDEDFDARGISSECLQILCLPCNHVASGDACNAQRSHEHLLRALIVIHDDRKRQKLATQFIRRTLIMSCNKSTNHWNSTMPMSLRRSMHALSIQQKKIVRHGRVVDRMNKRNGPSMNMRITLNQNKFNCTCFRTLDRQKTTRILASDHLQS